MDNTGYLLALLAVTAGITYLLRALPFLLFGHATPPMALFMASSSNR